jgi:hypothetical protein
MKSQVKTDWMRFALLGILCLLPLIGCQKGWGDPSSSALAVMSKHPASFTERLLALDALIRQTQGFPPYPTLAESLEVHRKRLKAHIGNSKDLAATVTFLKTYVSDSLGIHPQLDSTSLRFNLPSEVFQKRSGSCVGLSLLYLAFAEAITLPLRPVHIPGHMALRAETKAGPLYLETLKPYLVRDSAFYDSTFRLAFRPWYHSQTPQDIESALFGLLFNWANQLRYEGHKQWAEELYRFILQEMPAFPPAAGNLALLLQERNLSQEAQDLLKIATNGDSLSP